MPDASVQPVGSRRADSGFDVVVVGAGVIGLAIAEKLTAIGRSVLIVEREMAIARGITSRNSEVIHAGIYYPTDSLKARFCVEGRERLYAWCAARRVDCRRLGKWIVATNEDEEAVLEDLLSRGRANGVARLERIGSAQIARLEPGISARAAIDSPDTGIVDAHGLCNSLLAAAESAGAVLALGREVVGLSQRSYGWSIDVRSAVGALESIDAGIVVDAAGLDADRIASLAGLPIDSLGWRQHPCKGDYFALAPGASRHLSLPSRLVYPVPQSAGLGIHVTLDLAGRVRFGPDTEYVTECDYEVDPRKGTLFRAAVARYWPAIENAELVPDYAGIRPKLASPGRGLGGAPAEGFCDFVVEESSRHGAPGFVACVGLESPGLTAALAISEYVASI